jgi:hypothetical protein
MIEREQMKTLVATAIKTLDSRPHPTLDGLRER